MNVVTGRSQGAGVTWSRPNTWTWGRPSRSDVVAVRRRLAAE